MSKGFLKKWGKKFKTNGSEEAAPRTMEELNKAYAEELARAGQYQYMVYVNSKELENCNQRLIGINQEGARRQALDKAEAAQKKDAAAVAAVATPKAAQTTETTQRSGAV